MGLDSGSLIKTLNKTCLDALQAAAGLCLSRINPSVEVEHKLLKLAEAPDTDFAQRVAAGVVPPALRQVQVRALDLGLLQAGAGVKGEFESRLKQVIPARDLAGVPHPDGRRRGGLRRARDGRRHGRVPVRDPLEAIPLGRSVGWVKPALYRWFNIFDKLSAPRDLPIPRRRDSHDLQRRL